MFHKRWINNTMEFSNSRSHLTSQIKKNQMITKTGTTQIRNQIQVLMLKLKLTQMLLSEKREVNMRKLTMLTSPEDQILF